MTLIKSGSTRAAMLEPDVRQIVPSTRDLLQVLSTRRRNLALLGEVGDEGAAREAARLDDANVSAFAFNVASDAITEAARATKTVPSLNLAAVTSREDCQRARLFGADGVCIAVTLPLDEWDSLARVARGMRMLPLALVSEVTEMEAAQKVGARAFLLRADSSAKVKELAERAPRNVTLVADIAATENGARTGGIADAAGLRELSGKVDSAVVPAVVHGSAGFAELVLEIDP